jgi:hypothetical protein
MGRCGYPHRFVVLPKRWIVARALAWCSRNHRLACDFERYERRAVSPYWPRPWRVNAAGLALTKEGSESGMARRWHCKAIELCPTASERVVVSS